MSAAPCTPTPAAPSAVAKLLRRAEPWLLPVLLVLALLYPMLLPDQFWLRVMINIGLAMLMALGLNITVGFCGQLDLGYIAFFGLGAYTCAILTAKWGVSFWLALPASVAVGMAVGALLGMPVLRLRGDYLAIVTLGFAEVMRLAFQNGGALTNGPRGITSIPVPTVPFTGFALKLSSRAYAWHPYYYFLLGVIVLSVLVVRFLEDSAYGRAWKAIREDELAAKVMGIPVHRYKVLAYASGAGFGALAGCLMAPFAQVVAPRSFTFFESCMVLCMVVIGGLGTIRGALAGAALLGILPELLRALPDWVPALQRVDFYDYRFLLFGVMLVVIVILRPQGLFGERHQEA